MKAPTLIESHLEEAPFEELCDDSLVVGLVSPLALIILTQTTEPTDLPPISSLLLLTTPSILHAAYKSLGDLRGYNPSFGPNCAYLENMPRKIEWNTFLYYYFDFSMVFDKCKRALTFSAMILLVFS